MHLPLPNTAIAVAEVEVFYILFFIRFVKWPHPRQPSKEQVIPHDITLLLVVVDEGSGDQKTTPGKKFYGRRIRCFFTDSFTVLLVNHDLEADFVSISPIPPSMQDNYVLLLCQKLELLNSEIRREMIFSAICTCCCPGSANDDEENYSC